MTLILPELNQIIENSPGLIFWKDKDHRFLGCNKNLLILAGVSKFEDILYKTDFDLPWKSYAKKYQADDKKVFLGNELELLEYIKDKNNTILKVYVKKCPLYKDNEIIGLIGYARLIAILTENSSLDEKLKISLSSKHFIEKNEIKNYFSDLSSREAECLFYLIRGYTAREIAIKIKLSNRTIESYLTSVKSKFNAQSKSELISIAIKNGFYDVIPSGIQEI